jgi:hypothetical protein
VTLDEQSLTLEDRDGLISRAMNLSYTHSRSWFNNGLGFYVFVPQTNEPVLNVFLMFDAKTGKCADRFALPDHKILDMRACPSRSLVYLLEPTGVFEVSLMKKQVRQILPAPVHDLHGFFPERLRVKQEGCIAISPNGECVAASPRYFPGTDTDCIVFTNADGTRFGQAQIPRAVHAQRWLDRSYSNDVSCLEFLDDKWLLVGTFSSKVYLVGVPKP